MNAQTLTRPAERLRVVGGRELEKALHLIRFLSDAVLAMGARHRVSITIVSGVQVIRLDQLGGYYFLPVHRLLTTAPTGPDAGVWISGWRCDRVVHSPWDVSTDGESDVANGRIETLTCHQSDTIHALTAWVMADVHRQWVAESLDDFLVDEYSRPGIE